MSVAPRAASTLREQGFAGSITIIGDERIAPYERPPLSKATLVDLDDPQPVTVCSPDRFAALDIDFVSGTKVTSLDRSSHKVALSDGRLLAYDRLLLATGSRARTLPIPGGDWAVTLRTFADAMTLRRGLSPGARVVVVGAGFIGLEVAAGAVARGCRVTVIEIAPTAMARAVPSPVAERLVQRHREMGVEVLLATRVDSIDVADPRRPDVGFSVLLGDGCRLPADVVVAGIGAIPNAALAAECGLTVDNGIVVDEHLRTADTDILAAGDCCSFPHPLFDGGNIRLEAWRNAHDQAVVAARNLLGGHEVYRAVPWFWSDQYELGLQIAGLPHRAATEVVRHRADGVQIRFGLDAEGRLVSATGLAAGTSVARDIRVAEMLIADRAVVAPERLADASVTLKSLVMAR